MPHCALLLIDLDRFKNVNDTLGHPVGDKLLVQVVDRLKSAIREEDTLIRLGGDEFALIQCGAVQPAASDSLAKRLIDLVSRTYLIDQHVINIGASVGISVQDIAEASIDKLLKRADLALYHSKGNGRGQHHFFEEQMEQAALTRRDTEAALRKAIVLRQFEVHYQPLADLENQAILGAEALVRWKRPGQGLVPPDEFIPLAEETGLIVAIGDFVLQQACQAAAAWPNTYSIAVNVSPVQVLSPNFIETVRNALKRSSLAPERLEIEITENLLFSDAEAALVVLNQVKTLGVRIVMDDFGTGYSSLSYLRSFPFDKVKIDRSFVSNMDGSQESMGISQAIVDLGISLGMNTTAEGVETNEQLQQLKEQGCDEIQGYLISKPVTKDAIGEIFEDISAKSQTPGSHKKGS